MKSTLYSLVFLLLLFNTTNAAFNYSLSQNHTIGTWDKAGNGNLLNNPTSIFQDHINDTFIVSDSQNGRVLQFNSSTWNKIHEITPLYPNLTKVKTVYDTILQRNGTFTSILAKGRIISYQLDGKIIQSITIPFLPDDTVFFQNGKYVHLGYDSVENKILVQFPLTINGVRRVRVTTLETIKLNMSESNFLTKDIYAESQFSYIDGSPAALSQFYYQNGTVALQIKKFGMINGKYNITSTFLVPYASIGSMTGWLKLKNGYLFSTANGVLVYDLMMNLVNKFNDLNGFGKFDQVSSIVYDPISNLVILSLASKNFVIGIKVLTLTLDPTVSNSATQTELLIWIPVTLLRLIVLAVILITIILVIIVIKRRFIVNRSA